MNDGSKGGSRDGTERPPGVSASRPTRIETADEPRSEARDDGRGPRRTRLDQPLDPAPRAGRQTRLQGMGEEPLEPDPPAHGAEERPRPAARTDQRQTVLQDAGHGRARGPAARPLAAVLAARGPGTSAGAVFAVRRGRTRIGSDPGCDVCLDRDAEISGVHADLLSRADGVYLADRMSTNGTRLNGELIPPETVDRLEDRDVIQVGGTLLQFFVVDLEIPYGPSEGG